MLLGTPPGSYFEGPQYGGVQLIALLSHGDLPLSLCQSETSLNISVTLQLFFMTSL